MFFLWTLTLYWIHRFTHLFPLVRQYHYSHHITINKNLASGCLNKWHWNNLFLFNDNKESTLDLWITEVIPTIVFCAITNHWWILGGYYVWAAFVQEQIEHNPKVDLPLLLSGRKHLIHHKHVNSNFGLFSCCWDRLFGTYRHYV